MPSAEQHWAFFLGLGLSRPVASFGSEPILFAGVCEHLCEYRRGHFTPRAPNWARSDAAADTRLRCWWWWNAHLL